MSRRRAGDFPAERPADEWQGRLQGVWAVVHAHARARASRQNLLRLLGAALIIYGAIGLAATLYGHGLVSQAFASAREIGVLAPGEKNRALRGLQSISAILDDASTASANMSSSFKESQTSLTTAASVASDVAGSFRTVAYYTGFQLLGIQPLVGMGQPFTESADRLDALSQDLTRTSAAVGANAGDMRRLSTDFTRLKSEVEGVSQSVARLPADPTSGEGARRLETALNAMLVWIGLQGLASLFAGLAILLLPLARRA